MRSWSCAEPGELRDQTRASVVAVSFKATSFLGFGRLGKRRLTLAAPADDHLAT